MIFPDVVGSTSGGGKLPDGKNWFGIGLDEPPGEVRADDNSGELA